jgi:hypothetical protein
MNLRFLIFIFILMLALGANGCAVGSGCPAEKANTVKFDRRGKLKGESGKTRLLPKRK